MQIKYKEFNAYCAIIMGYKLHSYTPRGKLKSILCRLDKMGEYNPYSDLNQMAEKLLKDKIIIAGCVEELSLAKLFNIK